MATINLNNIQGDLYSRGFPKDHETYYFFTINEKEAASFVKTLPRLVEFGEAIIQPGEAKISTLNHVFGFRTQIRDAKLKAASDGDSEPDREAIVNALIAFSYTGLEKIETGLPDERELDLYNIKKSDPAFVRGMARDQALNDPARTTWDPLFRTPASIDGVLKIAGSSPDVINAKLAALKKALGHPFTITDVAGASPPDLGDSRVNGQVRPGRPRGREHFGFQDGISQPLIQGIDPEAESMKQTMFAPTNIIIVSKIPSGGKSGIEPQPLPDKRPAWMFDGSFMVFRKLEQDVQAFKRLTARYNEAGCESEDHLGAKLMGRWKSGAPLHEYPKGEPHEGAAFHKMDQGDLEDPKYSNEFVHEQTDRRCPLGAHIRKTNPRNVGRASYIIRSGIPYGSEISTDDEADKGERGLLFVCYQSSIEFGFRFIQDAWCNSKDFPLTGKDWVPGHDPLVGQPPPQEDRCIVLQDSGDKADHQLTKVEQLVTMKGGEYFFVPSIEALASMFKQGIPVSKEGVE